jgi:hypothetical protein
MTILAPSWALFFFSKPHLWAIFHVLHEKVVFLGVRIFFSFIALRMGKQQGTKQRIRLQKKFLSTIL